jgi:hypothetical protein
MARHFPQWLPGQAWTLAVGTAGADRPLDTLNAGVARVAHGRLQGNQDVPRGFLLVADAARLAPFGLSLCGETLSARSMTSSNCGASVRRE